MKQNRCVLFGARLGFLALLGSLAFAGRPAAPQTQPQIHWFGYTFLPAEGQTEVLAGDSHSLILPAGCSKLIRWDAGIKIVGSAVFDVRRGAFNTDPNATASITNGNSPMITNAFQNVGTDLSSWQNATQAGDLYVFTVSSISPGVTEAKVEISCQQ